MHHEVIAPVLFSLDYSSDCKTLTMVIIQWFNNMATSSSLFGFTVNIENTKLSNEHTKFSVIIYDIFLIATTYSLVGFALELARLYGNITKPIADRIFFCSVWTIAI